MFHLQRMQYFENSLEGFQFLFRESISEILRKVNCDITVISKLLKFVLIKLYKTPIQNLAINSFFPRKVIVFLNI